MGSGNFLGQFHETDQHIAKELISAITDVPTDEVLSSIRSLTLSIPKAAEKMALFVEREFEGGKAKQPIFRPVDGRAVEPKRVPLVAPVRGGIKVGSEGPLARLASQIADANKSHVLLSPGPELMRKKRPCKHIVIITDIIGSGTRIFRMLESFHKVATVRSWSSIGCVRFHVVAYTASAEGKRKVQQHKLRPRVHCHRPLPTVATEFAAPRNGVSEAQIRDLCRRYDPLGLTNPGEPLGYKNTGALMSIGGGCPNNAPRLLWEKAGRWKPLFTKFVLSEPLPESEAEFDRMVRVLEAFTRNLRITPAQLSQVWGEARPLVVLLAAMRSGVCGRDELAGLVKLTFAETDRLIARAASAGWIDDNRKLTFSGRHLIRELAGLRELRKSLPPSHEVMYLPQQLRAPV